MDKYIVRDLGWDGSPKCRLRKTSRDLRQMSGSQLPKRIRQKGTSTSSGTWNGTDLPNAASGKRPRISGKCPDLKYQRGIGKRGQDRSPNCRLRKTSADLR